MNSREKKLIGLVAALFLLMVLYYVLYRPLQLRKVELDDDIAKLQVEVNDLKQEYNKLPIYRKGIESAKEVIQTLEDRYPNGVSQEGAFELLFAIEDEIEAVDFEAVTFELPEVMYYSNEEPDENTLFGVRQSMTTTVNMTYDDLKTFLAFLYDYDARAVLTDLGLELNELDNNIVTNLNINMYAIEGGDRVYTAPKFEEVPQGKNQVFDSPDLDLDYNAALNKRPSDDRGDLFITLKPTKADVEAQILGMVDDNNQSTYVREDENATVQAIVTIYKKDDGYYADYDMGGNTQSSMFFEIGEALELDLYSSKRIDDQDLSAMVLTVVNTTDMTLYINRHEEDEANPRLTVNISSGKVVFD